MLIEWIGHASFRITMNDKTSVVTDPFDETVGYAMPKQAADIVTISHDHFDHNDMDALKAQTVLKSAGHFPGKVTVTGYPSFHDAVKGAQRGGNVMFLCEGDGMRVLHLGDLGHDLSDDEITAFGKIDVLLIPVGGIYTLDAHQAAALARRIGARVTVPMHYKTPQLTFELGSVTPFVEDMAAMGASCAECDELDPMNPPASVAIMRPEHGR